MRIPHGTLKEIVASSRSIHGSGSLSPAALIRLAWHLEARTVERSVETGVGASTLIFSHLSRSHTAFALDSDGSITRVRSNPSLRRENTAFIEGPTQKTLPAYSFQGPVQAALIDGPHAYPFPELEYFYLYPHIERGGLLAIDDIHIPSIHNLFRFVSRDEMFRVLEVLGKTAFLERTGAPLFDPWGDGWWTQRFNSRTLWRYSWQDRLKSAAPRALRPALRAIADRIRLRER